MQKMLRLFFLMITLVSTSHRILCQDWMLGSDPNIDLKQADRQELSKMLNQILADEYVLYTKAQNYHWNVVGVHFYGLHKFFGEIYEELAKIIDLVAERVRALGGRTSGTLDEWLKITQLQEEPGQALDADTMVKNLLEDFETIITSMRKAIADSIDQYGDAATNNLLTDIIAKHEKRAWMLRALADESMSNNVKD